MADKNGRRKRIIRHRGRGYQIPIYFMKHVRMFVYQKDWIVLPMSALIAGMVSMVIRHGFGRNMEYTLTGSFALTCVAIWNGCFNSIQVVCRERAIVKREHRSGMHVTSYIASHMVYQAILCVMQSALTVYICKMCGVALEGEGVITQWKMIDIGLSMFIISYTADMLSLLISSVVHTTTAAMTVMPFVLIFQLVFSGAVFPLPKWAVPIAKYTISNYGMNCIAAQAHYNELPMETGWNILNNLRDGVLVESQTFGTILDNMDMTVEKDDFSREELDEIVVDEIKISDVMKIIGEEELKDTIITKTSEINRKDQFEATKTNVVENWINLIGLGLLYVICAVICLEFIDKDKR